MAHNHAGTREHTLGSPALFLAHSCSTFKKACSDCVREISSGRLVAFQGIDWSPTGEENLSVALI